MDRTRFETLVEEAVQGLPRRFKKHLKNIAVLVEDNPPAPPASAGRSGTLLGLYHGLPYPERGATYGSVLPDVIVIYRKPIESLCSTEDEVRRRVRQVVLHEFGHFFGLSEKELRDIEREVG